MDTSSKQIGYVTFPIFLTLLTQSIVNVTNTAFLGHVGEVELGASAIGGVFYVGIYMIGFGFSQGCQILIGRRNGEKEYSKIGRIFNNGLLFIVLLALIFILLAEYSISPLLGAMVKSEDIYRTTVRYLNWRLLGVVFMFVNIMYRALYVGIARTKVLSISAAVTAVVNVILDYTLIFGNFGFPTLGITGAAIASIIAETTATVFLTVYTLKKTNFRQYGLFSLARVEWLVIKQTLDISIYMMFQHLISVSTWFLFFILIERMGERPLAVSNITRSLYAILMVPGNALAATNSTMISNLIGEGKLKDVIPLLKKILIINIWVYAPFVLLFLLLPEPLIRIYTSDAALIAASVPALRAISLAIMVFGTGTLLFVSVSAIGNTRLAFIFVFSVLIFYISYIFSVTVIWPSPVAVVWLSEYIYWGMIGFMSFLYLKYGSWQRIVI